MTFIYLPLETKRSPTVITPPYFYIDSIDSDWLKVNIELAYKTKELTEKEVVPIILTSALNLTEELLDKYKGFNKLILWIDNLDEKYVPTRDISVQKQYEKLQKYLDFVIKARMHNIEIFNLFGTYFSLLLTKFGLKGISNGVFYGEERSRKTKVGGGPPARYYIRKLHEFFSTSIANALLTRFPELMDKDNYECMNLIKEDPNNILLFDKKHAAAQKHFIYSRAREIHDLINADIKDLLAELELTYRTYPSLPEIITDKPTSYLKYWFDVISTKQP